MPRSGVAYAEALEHGLCARWWGYRMGEWEELDAQEQAYCLAVYQCQCQIDAVIAAFSK